MTHDKPYVFMVGQQSTGKRWHKKVEPLKAIVIMADSEDLAWGLFRKAHGYDKWNIVELEPTSINGKKLGRLAFKDRKRTGVHLNGSD